MRIYAGVYSRPSLFVSKFDDLGIAMDLGYEVCSVVTDQDVYLDRGTWEVFLNGANQIVDALAGLVVRPEVVAERRDHVVGGDAQVGRAVVEHAQVTTADLLTFTRAKPVLEARWLAYWLLVNVGGLSYAATGRLLSRDHSTVITAVNRVDADPGLLAVAQEIAGRMRDEVAA